MDVSSHKLQDAILSLWANISKECFQHLVESMPHRITAVLKAKGGQTVYGVPNNPLGECILLNYNVSWYLYFQFIYYFVYL